MVQDRQKNKEIKAAYNALNQYSKQILKQNILKINGVDVSQKTIQRWFYAPDTIPPQYFEAIIKELMAVALFDNNENEIFILTAKSKLSKANAKKRNFQQFLNHFSTFNTL